jgi:hypothetical protein
VFPAFPIVPGQKPFDGAVGGHEAVIEVLHRVDHSLPSGPMCKQVWTLSGWPECVRWRIATAHHEPALGLTLVEPYSLVLHTNYIQPLGKWIENERK